MVLEDGGEQRHVSVADQRLAAPKRDRPGSTRLLVSEAPTDQTLRRLAGCHRELFRGDCRGVILHLGRIDRALPAEPGPDRACYAPHRQQATVELARQATN